jgi:hypothetical protein
MPELYALGDKQARLQIAGAGYLTRILAALDRHLDVAPLQAVCFRALFNMMLAGTESEVNIVSEAAISRVFAAIERHVDDCSVQVECCNVLSRLSADAGSHDDDQPSR